MIYGKRIRLRAPERSDIPMFVGWLNLPDVRQGLVHYRPFSLVEEEHWFENMLERPADEHPLVIEIPENETWRPIGNCSYMNIEWRNRLAEVGIFIGETAYWNHGYGSEAMGLLLRHAFDTLNLNRIFLRVFENNLRAIRCYEKAGFMHEGRLRQAEYQDGQFLDVLLMSVLRQEWKQEG